MAAVPGRQGVRDGQRALAFPQVAANLLAVARLVADEIQHVVVDLERGAEQEPELMEPIERVVVGARDDRADPHRVDEAVPGRLLEHEPQVVVGADAAVVVANPAELERLPLERLDQHVIDFVEDAQSRARSRAAPGCAGTAASPARS